MSSTAAAPIDNASDGRVPVVAVPGCATTENPAAHDSPLSGAKLLVVEDDARSARLCQAKLAASGYRVVVAATAAAAHDESIAQPPDLILCDICLPDGDGISLTQWFRRQPQLAGVPILLITSVDDRKVLARGIEAGADDFLTKPVNTLELRSRVQSLLRNKFLADELRAQQQAALPFVSSACDSPSSATLQQAGESLSSATAAGSHGGSILLIEDNEIERRLLATYLNGLGCQVHTAGDAASGLAMLKRSPPDLVVLDLLLPDASGFSVIEQMKAAPALKQVPVLVVSGMSQVQDRVRALELGADDFIVKSFERLEFEARVRRLLRLKRSLDQLNSRCDQALQQAVTDSLTGLYTHGFLQETLSRQLLCARRHSWPLSILFIDIDRFKQINDQNGHAVGDLVLRTLAATLRDNTRRSDIPVRYGGEEFVILLPHTDSPGAQIIAEQLRRKIEQTTIELQAAEHRAWMATVSIGVATFPHDAQDSPELLERADAAMYRAKRQGRNRVVAFSAEAPQDEQSHPRVLIADDDARNARLLEAYLATEGYTAIKAADGAEALEVAQHERPDLVLLDGMMPELDGFEVCRRLKQDRATSLTPVVIVTALSSREDRLRGIEAGADDFLRKPIDKVELLTRLRTLLRMKQSTDQLEDADSVILALARVVESRDASTGGHVERVANYAVALGRALGLGHAACEALRRAGYVHDIGKIVIPDAILLKAGKLTPEERRLMERHVEAGYELLRPLRTFAESLPAVRYHHERLDGSGYPFGLRGPQIPLAAQIIAVVDIYDALTTDRPYRPALSQADALAILDEETERGMHDPTVLNAFAGQVLQSEPAPAAV